MARPATRRKKLGRQLKKLNLVAEVVKVESEIYFSWSQERVLLMIPQQLVEESFTPVHNTVIDKTKLLTKRTPTDACWHWIGPVSIDLACRCFMTTYRKSTVALILNKVSKQVLA